MPAHPGAGSTPDWAPTSVLCQDILYSVYQDILYTWDLVSGRTTAVVLPDKMSISRI